MTRFSEALANSGSVPTLAWSYSQRQHEQWLPAEGLFHRRNKRFRSLFRTAYGSDFYRTRIDKLGVKPEEITDEGFLRVFPILEKDHLRTFSPASFTTQRARLLEPIRTTGTTGSPVEVYRSQLDQAHFSATWLRTNRAFGRRFFDRIVNLASGNSYLKRGPVLTLYRLGLVPSQISIAATEPIERQIDALIKLQPQVLTGYSNALELLSERILALGIQQLRPRVVYGGGVPLTERCRRLVREALGARIFDSYASIELGSIAWECPEAPGQLHTNDDVMILETVDMCDEPTEPGTPGQLLVTPLLLRSFPLIRYRLGDVVTLSDDKCSCGRGLGMMKNIDGRTSAIIRSREGRTFYEMTICGIAKSMLQKIKRIQVKQVCPQTLEIRVIREPLWLKTDELELLAKFREKFGTMFDFQFVYPEELEAGSGGKFSVILPLHSISSGDRTAGH